MKGRTRAAGGGAAKAKSQRSVAGAVSKKMLAADAKTRGKKAAASAVDAARAEVERAEAARAEAIAAALAELYPEAECALAYGGDAWRLLVMGRLSAQCTDARVNRVAPALFAAYPTPEAMAEAVPEELEQIIRPCGLFRTKARDLIAASRLLVLRFGGVLPESREALLTLPGVGRKIANLLLGDIYGHSLVVADTHCIRLASRFGFTPEGTRDALLTERRLTPLLQSVNASDFCHRLVLFGREVCTARAPQCRACLLRERGLCRYGDTPPSAADV